MDVGDRVDKGGIKTMDTMLGMLANGTMGEGSLDEPGRGSRSSSPTTESMGEGGLDGPGMEAPAWHVFVQRG